MMQTTSITTTNFEANTAMGFEQIGSRLSSEISSMKFRLPNPSIERISAFFLLITLAPLLLFIAVIVRLSSRGSSLFVQERCGLDGRSFGIYKFRTMIANAEQSTGPTLSWQGDPRVTHFGRFLRKTHLDELPQLLNILKGEMSFIGPRPERPIFCQQIQARIPFFRVRERVLPGVTGLAQVMAPYDATPEEKLIFDMQYIRDQSLRLRLQILWLTILAMIGMRRQWRVSTVVSGTVV
jgi:lipopolysaccharide/colanic/teichoic acid biosynthesis glycosyltransferase